jgi:hypothetical protein
MKTYSVLEIAQHPTLKPTHDSVQKLERKFTAIFVSETIRLYDHSNLSGTNNTRTGHLEEYSL